MARKLKHDQKAIPDTGWKCSSCEDGRCLYCLDISRIKYGFGDPLCQCRREFHAKVIELTYKEVSNNTPRSVEPRDRQILDPATGTVYAPGLTVNIEGDVRRG